MALYPKISVYYLALMMNGLGGGMIRPAISSALSLSQLPENQGSAAGYLGSVYPIGHMLTPIVAMPIYSLNPSFLYLFNAFLSIVIIIFIVIMPIFKNSQQK
jgi:hypothetical protein